MKPSFNYNYVVNIPDAKFKDIDHIFCDKNYDLSGEKPIPFEGIKCLNYRLVGLSNEPDARINLKVGSIDMDAMSSHENLVKYISNPVVCDSVQVKKLKDRGLLESKTTVYFKGAFTLFPEEW